MDAPIIQLNGRTDERLGRCAYHRLGLWYIRVIMPARCIPGSWEANDWCEESRGVMHEKLSIQSVSKLSAGF